MLLPALNATVVLTSQYLEGATVTPVIVPAVRHQPVRCAPLLPPAQQSDSVTSQWLPRHVLINSRLVVGEVLEHGEGSLGRSIGHQLHLDSLDIPPDGVALLTIGLVLLIGDLVLGVVTGSVTLGCAGALLTMIMMIVQISLVLPHTAFSNH